MRMCLDSDAYWSVTWSTKRAESYKAGVKLLMVSLMHPGNLSQQETNFKSSHSLKPSHSHGSQSGLNSVICSDALWLSMLVIYTFFCLLSGSLVTGLCTPGGFVKLMASFSYSLSFFKCSALIHQFASLSNVLPAPEIFQKWLLCKKIVKVVFSFIKTISTNQPETPCQRRRMWIYVLAFLPCTDCKIDLDRCWGSTSPHDQADPRTVVWEAVGLIYRTSRHRWKYKKHLQ